ncbi:MAG: hypothetical protein LBG81_00040, partial [Coriobacteriaceae bacterium]|nr:hypothetical protein [Coriobacteriaceae bacterium]
MIGQTPYEAWVRRLREWAKDPDTPLDDLPALAGDDRMTPEVYERLIDHIERANRGFMDVFGKRLQDVFKDPDGQAIARAYHNLQYLYARRLAFALHPGLPEKISSELLRVAEEDLKDIQAEVERMVGQDKGRGSVNDASNLLRIIKQNSLLQLLHVAPGSAPDGAATGQTDKDQAGIGQGNLGAATAGNIKSQVNLIPTYDPKDRKSV